MRKLKFPEVHFDDMTRKQKREYKRWLSKNKLWDGAEVIERLKKKQDLEVKD